MQRIFIRVDTSNTNVYCNERRRNGTILANPCRTGHIFPPSALRPLDGAPLLPHANTPCWTKKFEARAESVKRL